MLEDHSTPIVHAELWYHVGSKNEKPGRTGFAHLFEHMMFKGSKNVEPEGHPSWISSVGGQSNASTNEDATVFWQTLPAQYLPLVLWLEADRMASLRIDEAIFKNEREVVKEERRMRVENQPYGRLNEIIYDQAFTVHPYKHPTIGSMKDLEAASIDDVREFFRTYYVPNNATLVLAGDFDSQGSAGAGRAVSRTGAEVRQAGAARHPEGAAADEGAARHASRRAGRCRPWSSPTTSRTTAIRTRIRCTSPRRSCPTGRARASTSKLVYEKQLALAAFGGGNIIEHPNLFFAVAIVQPGKTPEQATNALIAELDRLRNEPITAGGAAAGEEPVRARLHLRPRVEQGQGHTLGHAAVIHDDIKTADGEFDIFMNITPADVQRVAQTYFTPENRLVITIMPQGRVGRWGTAVSARRFAPVVCLAALRRAARPPRRCPNWPTERPPRPLPAHDVKFPPYEIRTLPNGLQVIAVSHHEQPAVSLRLIVRAGGAQDPGQQARRRHARGHAARPGHDHQERRADRAARSTRSAARWASAPGPT